MTEKNDGMLYYGVFSEGIGVMTKMYAEAVQAKDHFRAKDLGSVIFNTVSQVVKDKSAQMLLAQDIRDNVPEDCELFRQAGALILKNGGTVADQIDVSAMLDLN